MMFKYLKMVEVHFAKKVDFFFRSSLEEKRFMPGVINVHVIFAQGISQMCSR